MTALSEETMSRLAFIRYQYGLAVEQAGQPEPANALSVNWLHDSVELTLQLASELANVQIRPKSKPHMMDYFGLLDPRFPPNGLAQRNAMNRLNEARVALKHHGTRPATSDILALRASVTAFFEENIPRVFGISFDQIAMSQLVTQLEARSHLQTAETQAAAGDREEAVNSTAIAFAYLLRAYHAVEPEVRASSAPISHLLGGAPRHDFSEVISFVERLIDAVNTLQRRVEWLAIGAYPPRMRRFSRLTPSVMIAYAGNWRMSTRPRSVPLTDLDVRFCYEFVIEVALTLQKSVFS